MEDGELFAVQAAKFSLWAPIIMIVANLLAKASGAQAVALLIGVISMVAYLAGLAMGIVALFGVRKHGKEGILVRGILGTTLNGAIILLAILSIPALMKVRAMAQEKQAAIDYRAQAVADFSFAAPEGFVVYPDGMEMFANLKQAYIKGDPSDEELDILLFVEDLGGTIRQGEDLSGLLGEHTNVRLLEETWKSYQVTIFEVTENLGEAVVLTYNAQVPTLPTAVQIKVIGLESKKDELQEVVRQALAGVEGQTDWK